MDADHRMSRVDDGALSININVSEHRHKSYQATVGWFADAHLA